MISKVKEYAAVWVMKKKLRVKQKCLLEQEVSKNTFEKKQGKVN